MEYMIVLSIPLFSLIIGYIFGKDQAPPLVDPDLFEYFDSLIKESE